MQTIETFQTVAPYTLSTDARANKPASIETVLTDRHAACLCLQRTHDAFAQDLAAYWHAGQLSHNRRVWLHIKGMQIFNALRTPAPAATPATPATAGPLASIVALFTTAKEGGKKGAGLKIRIGHGTHRINIKLAGSNSRNQGWLYVKSDDDFTYLGKISPEGTFFPVSGCGGYVLRLLENFAADPAAYAKEFGHKTNICCFCGRLLTDDREGRSVEVGYGPVCAQTWGMPWGK